MYELMVVDDEPLTREYMIKNVPLLNNNWVVSGEAMDGFEALVLLGKQHFDLVITDIKMPDMDGLELSRRISEQYENQRVVILSGYDDFNYARQAMSCGVREYLLKPLVKNELRSLLDKIALQAEEEKRSQAAYQAVKRLSDESVKQVVRNFLKAVLSDSNVEIKALYPLIHQLKINLMESAGVILAFEMDEDILLSRSIPPSDIPVYRFILNRIASEILEEDNYCTVFFDECENTKILITGDYADSILEKCKTIYTLISSEMFLHTDISATAAVGYPVDDIFQLKNSNDRAVEILLKRLESGNTRLYLYDEELDPILLNKAVSSVKRAILENNEATCKIEAAEYAGIMKASNIFAAYRYGIYLIKCIRGARAGFPDEQADAALKVLSGLKACDVSAQTSEKIVSTFRNMLSIYINYSQGHAELNKNDIVNRAKEYIYAHYPEPISLALVAEKTGVSPCYLSDIFRKSEGESYIKFLTRIRMEQAAKLLNSSPAQRILDIPEKVGYINVKHFSYIFKQHFGITPGEYQNGAGR